MKVLIIWVALLASLAGCNPSNAKPAPTTSTYDETIPLKLVISSKSNAIIYNVEYSWYDPDFQAGTDFVDKLPWSMEINVKDPKYIKLSATVKQGEAICEIIVYGGVAVRSYNYGKSDLVCEFDANTPYN